MHVRRDQGTYTQGHVDQALNVGFFIVHTAWIAFNCLGWIWRRTRPWQLATVSLTAFSWFGLGVVYGWGYCPCTDWHWEVRARLGADDPPSYSQLLARVLTGIELRQPVADTIAVVTLGSASLLGVALTIRERQRSARGAS